MDELIKAMSDKDIKDMMAKYPDNKSVQDMLQGVLATRQAEAEQAKAKEAFIASIDKLIAKLPHPNDVYNVLFRWAEVEEPDVKQKPVEVDIPAIGDKPAHKEMRQPTIKVNKWVVELNKGFQVGKSTTKADGTSGPSKRAITLHKRNGTVLTFVGNFKSGQAAADYLKLNTAQDSATRVLARDGYISDQYNGTDFTS